MPATKQAIIERALKEGYIQEVSGCGFQCYLCGKPQLLHRLYRVGRLYAAICWKCDDTSRALLTAHKGAPNER